MPFQNIVIKDGKPTPVDHTFRPVRRAELEAQWGENSPLGTLQARNGLSVTHKLPGKGTTRKTAAVTVALAVPVVITENINGVNREVVTSVARAEVTIVSNPDVSAAARKDLRVLISNALLNVDIADAIDQLNGF